MSNTEVEFGKVLQAHRELLGIKIKIKSALFTVPCKHVFIGLEMVRMCTVMQENI